MCAPGWATHAEKAPKVRHLLTVYDGQRMLGRIEEGRTCIAHTAEGELVGEFENRKAAVRAFFARKAAGTLTVQG
jgi:hypothetical protein